MKKILSILLFICFTVSTYSQSEILPIQKIDSLIEKTMKAFNVPGVAIAIVKDSSIVYAKGYGETKINSGEKVDSKTLFGVASNTKAFAAATLAILVDEGKIKWDDKVIKYLPEFQLYDPYVTREITVRDLLTHKSGIVTGYGDLLLWPETEFTRSEIISRMKYLKPTYSFRSRFGYSNLLYVVAGEVVKAVTGKEWEVFLKERIFIPLEMNSSLALMSEVRNKKNRAFPHVEYDGKLNWLELDAVDNGGAATSIISNVEDMSKWMITQLKRGRISGKTERIFSKRQSDEMWKPHTILSGSADKNPNTQGNFSMYGLGWNIQDIRGNYVVSHTGGLVGMVSKLSLVPEKNLGVVVLTNQQEGSAFNLITNLILDYYLAGEIFDNVESTKERVSKRVATAEKEVKEKWEKRDAKSKPTFELNKYAGEYSDEWFGKIKLELTNKILEMTFEKSPKLKGKLKHYQYNTFIVEWDYRELLADCYVTFIINKDGDIERIKMDPVSPLIDFSFDFQDLDLKRVK